MKFKEKYIGDKNFYRALLIVVVPLIIQNAITNFVSLLDNIMIGRIGTEQMSGVAIVNQLLFVFNIGVFGITSAVGIFTAQFYGAGNEDGVRESFRLKIIASSVFTVLAILVFKFFGGELISLFLNDTGEGGNIQLTLEYGLKYLDIILIQIVPFTVVQIYASTLRERGVTVLPMICGTVAVFVNLAFNAVLIYGLLGMPALGVKGAAIATLIARLVEMVAIIVCVHKDKVKNPYIIGVYRNFKISRTLVMNVAKLGTPLILNEFLWSLGMTMLNQSYSTRGLDVVGALNISSTLSNLFNVVFISMGSAVGIMVGQQLGAGNVEKAKDTVRKEVFACVGACIIIGSLLALVAGVFPEIYNTSNSIKNLAKTFIRISALFMPVIAFVNMSYFTMRSGGKTLITFLFDSCYVWVVCIPLVYCLTRFTNLGIIVIFFACQSLEIIKAVIGYVLLKTGFWINKMV
ncbi:MAG: MATE family efflux transporter [Lachnospiraceae bacterium]|nr:MATE family efflux transporter [Lachnospiraceae bacterium]